jgi:hypothetical protein
MLRGNKKLCGDFPEQAQAHAQDAAPKSDSQND